MDNQTVIDAFHMMWDNFPEPVMLIQKSRQIYAVNKKAASMGLNTEMKCSQIGTKPHRGCLCNKAADEKKAVYITYETPLGQAYGYWIPVAGHEEYLLHFGVGYTFEYPKANAQ